MNKFLIVLPAYNEEKTIHKVIKQIKEAGYDFIAVNDGSTDNTVDSIFKECNYCIGYATNMGKGYAVKMGAEYAFGKGYDWILILDSDGQMSIDDIKQFETTINMNCYEEARIVIGNRLHNAKNMPIIRKLVNYTMSYIISKLANQSVKDSQCGMRAIHKDVFDLDLESNRFELETEMLLKAGKANMKIINVPIKCIYYKERQSKINPVKDLIRFLKCLKI